MQALRTALRGLMATLRRARALVRDDDHDDWYDARTQDHDKPTNLAGPWSQGGG